MAQACVAMVGARRCTGLGRRMARQLAQAAVTAGAVVVSGLAYGIDMAAHQGAMPRTIAVLGQGLGSRLSSGQRRLADAIVAEGGLLLSEFPPSFPPSRYTFPQRNRVIAGLSQATVVVEAGWRSGARITARCAAEAGREVLAVPGHPLAENSAGCNGLIADGAGMVRRPADVLACLELPGASPQARLLEALRRGGTLDELAERTARDPIDLTCALAAMELAGLVDRLPGDRFVEHR